MKALLIISIALLLFILIFLLTGAAIAYNLAFRSKRKKDPFWGLDYHPEFMDERRRLISDLLAMPYERVTVRSDDGLTLVGRYYHQKDGAPLEIQFHGYKSISVRDFSGGALECRKAGHNLLLVDQRAHGESEGRVISFGVKERFDCLRWIEYARERFGEDVKIILVGISMGAATVLMAAGEELPASVACVIADCPYSSQAEIIEAVGKRMHIPSLITRIIAPIGAALYGRFSFLESTPIGAVERAEVPILIIHGDADGLVPYEMAERLAEKNPRVRLEKFPGADHGLSYLTDTERYSRLVGEFIAEALNEGKNDV